MKYILFYFVILTTSLCVSAEVFKPSVSQSRDQAGGQAEGRFAESDGDPVAGVVEWFLQTNRSVRDSSGCHCFSADSLRGISQERPQGQSDFTSRESFISFVCENSRRVPFDVLLKKLQQNGGAAAVTRASSGELTLGEFAKNLEHFLKFNGTIAKQFSMGTDKVWTMSTKKNDVQCLPRTRALLGVKVQYNGLNFLGVRHFRELHGDDLAKATRDLRELLNRNSPDALLLEGYEYGQPLPCDPVLRAVLTQDSEIKDEGDLLLKYGFRKNIAMIPADNQTIEESDIDLFFDGDHGKAQKAASDIQLVDILHNYYAKLSKNSVDPLGSAIETARKKWPVLLVQSADEFKARYRQLNGRELSDNLKIIDRDFTPTKEFTKAEREQEIGGTNRLVDIQDALRNQSLLRSIQLSTQTHRKPMAVFGSSHLEDLAQDLEEHLGPALRSDLQNDCPKPRN